MESTSKPGEKAMTRKKSKEPPLYESMTIRVPKELVPEFKATAAEYKAKKELEKAERLRKEAEAKNV